jgi:hypothetical protein
MPDFSAMPEVFVSNNELVHAISREVKRACASSPRGFIREISKTVRSRSYLDEYQGRIYIWSISVGGVARRLTLLYPAGSGAAGFRRDPHPHGLGKTMMPETERS